MPRARRPRSGDIRRCRGQEVIQTSQHWSATAAPPRPTNAAASSDRYRADRRWAKPPEPSDTTVPVQRYHPDIREPLAHTRAEGTTGTRADSPDETGMATVRLGCTPMVVPSPAPTDTARTDTAMVAVAAPVRSPGSARPAARSHRGRTTRPATV